MHKKKKTLLLFFLTTKCVASVLPFICTNISPESFVSVGVGIYSPVTQKISVGKFWQIEKARESYESIVVGGLLSYRLNQKSGFTLESGIQRRYEHLYPAAISSTLKHSNVYTLPKIELDFNYYFNKQLMGSFGYDYVFGGSFNEKKTNGAFSSNKLNFGLTYFLKK